MPIPALTRQRLVNLESKASLVYMEQSCQEKLKALSLGIKFSVALDPVSYNFKELVRGKKKERGNQLGLLICV